MSEYFHTTQEAIVLSPSHRVGKESISSHTWRRYLHFLFIQLFLLGNQGHKARGSVLADGVPAQCHHLSLQALYQ